MGGVCDHIEAFDSAPAISISIHGANIFIMCTAENSTVVISDAKYIMTQSLLVI